MYQHYVPKYMNRKWKLRMFRMFELGGRENQRFLRLYRETLWNKKRKARTFVTIIFTLNRIRSQYIHLSLCIYSFKLTRIIFFFRRERNRVAMLIRKFPNLDLEAVKEQFPDVDIKAVKETKRARGHIV